MCIWESCKPFGMAGASGVNGSVTRSKAEEATELRRERPFRACKGVWRDSIDIGELGLYAKQGRLAIIHPFPCSIQEYILKQGRL